MTKLMEMIEYKNTGERVAIDMGMSNAQLSEETIQIDQPREGYRVTHRLRVGNQSTVFDGESFEKVNLMAKRSICRLVYADIHEHLELLYQAVGTGNIMEVKKTLNEVSKCYKGL